MTRGRAGQKALTLTIGTLTYNAFPEMRDTLASVLQTDGPYSFIFLDNGSDEPLERFLFDDLEPYWGPHCPKGPVYLRNDGNVGFVVGSQQIVEHCETDLLAIIHNDVRITQPGWDAEVLGLFRADPKLGLAAFFGCPGVTADGRRGGLYPGVEAGWSNMVDAEHHGARISQACAMAAPDSFAMILRRRMLERAGGYDLRFSPNYACDVALGLQSLAAGFHNVVAPVACEHMGERTRSTPHYMRWLSRTLGVDDQWALFRQKDALLAKVWGPCLPLYVNEDFTFREADPFTGTLTGGPVVGYDWRSA